MIDKANLTQNSNYPTKVTQTAFALFEKLPPEAIIKVVDVMADIARANKILKGNDQEFHHTLTMLREKSLDRKERLNLLSVLISNPSLSESDISTIVTTICNIAESKSG
jgi:hypothetical protein